jgi:DNA-binding CsgD family transcriptional regulator
MTIHPTSPFVGRSEELDVLTRALSETDAAGGRFIALAGEAGVGKTRLLAKAAEIAKAQGKQALWGQVIEEPGTIPYVLWVLVLRACLQQEGNHALLREPDPIASDLVDILPELRNPQASRPRQSVTGPSAARYQLFDSVTRFLLSVAKRQPIVILLDNLHYADRSSLALLEYFCQQITSYPVLVLGAYRDSELSRSLPLRPVLNRLSRGIAYARIRIGGLTREEVAELLHAYLLATPPAPIVDSVYEQSGGNPLFITEVGSMLARQSRDKRLPSAGFRFRVPESLREVISARLDNLPSDVCRLLSIAAVIGREFDVAFLSELADSRSERLALSLQTAENAGVISLIGPDSYRFHHALFREVLYADHSTVTRVMLHRKAGEYLELRYRDDQQDYLSQLAHHFFEATQAGIEHKAVHYCRLAAESAIARRAYSEAVALFECALQAMELGSESDTAMRYELLVSIGSAQYQSGQLNASTNTFMKAAIQAWRHHWWARLANALIDFQHVCQQSGLRHVASVPLHQAVLDHIDQDSVALRARVLASLAKAYRTAAEPDKAIRAFQTGVSLARECGESEVLLDCLRKGAWIIGRTPEGAREGLEISREALELAKQIGSTEAILDALTDIVFQLSDLGEINEMEQQVNILRSLALAERQPHFLNMLEGFETTLAILKGRWSEAMKLARSALKQAPLLGAYGLEGRFSFQMFAMNRAQGSLGDIADLAERIIGTSGSSQLWLPGQILLLCELGKHGQARDALVQLGNLDKLPRDDLFAVALVYLAEACSQLRDLPRCTKLYELLLPYRGLNATLAGTLMLGAAAEYLARLAFTLSRYGDARELFEEALTQNISMHAAPAVARTQVSFAQLLLRGDSQKDHVKARKLLAEAIPVARKLKLLPVLEAIEKLEDGIGAENLTDREIEVLKQIAAGASNRKIAETLHISHSTVATHVRNIFRKIGAANRTEAANLARRSGVLQTG